ncbi:MAG: CDP-diacylglycerol--serine O-phosphatidyltransferase [Candidatus Marinimicrobia bacterium]|nr:CDP-diacylglycerol--serine O-phosphatidyltransferase [Candidatus Neomarinimicrobiota bacterium]
MKLTKAVVPSVLTVMNFFSGYLAILLTANGKLSTASYLILLAGFFDAFDGKVARKINQHSKFGLEFDSLADITSFGVAPSLLIYKAFSGEWVVIGALVAFLPLLFAGIRLARFNIHSEEQKSLFIGLPAPSSAALLAAFVLFYLEIPYNIGALKFVLPLLIGSSFLMVSTIPFYKFPVISIKLNGKPNILLFVFISSLVVMLIFKSLIIFPIFFIFLMYNIIRWAFTYGKTEDSEMANSGIRE